MRSSQVRNQSPGLKLGQEGLEIIHIQSSVAHVIRKKSFGVQDIICFIKNLEYLLQEVRSWKQARVVSSSIRTVITKYHKLGSLYTIGIYFSPFQRLESPRSKHWHIQCLVKAHFLESHLFDFLS